VAVAELVRTTERRFRDRTDPVALVASDAERELGLWSAGWDWIRGKSKVEVLREALEPVQKDKSFDPGPPIPDGHVGVVCGSAHAAYLAGFFPDLHVDCFTRAADALAELKAGRIAAVFGDALSLSFWLNGPPSGDCCRFEGGAYLDDRYFGSGFAIVMKAEDRELKFAIDYALREVYRAGAYEELYLRYFPVGLF